jgi:7,8-dihydropterin-6-yl-methyl-4-(beta-D-ribofuranosyl)aminobenzene 5'-phosphate synthase
MNVRITALAENTAGPGVLAEWGWSVLVEADGVRILMDTGQSSVAVHNAGLLRLDLRQIDKLVLSHGHYDHTGGLEDVLRRTGEREIIAHPDIWDEKYAVYGASRRYIGIPAARPQLESLGARFRLSKEPVWITDRIVTSGEIPMTTAYEKTDAHLCVHRGDSMEPDPFADDLAIAVKTEKGLIVILGCAHRGMVNTLRHFQKLTGEERVHCVIGGTHLIAASAEWLAQAAADLRKIGVGKLGVSHCTGFSAASWLAAEFPGTFFQFNAGSVVSLP